MRKLLTLVLGVAACFGASAQYISLQQGTTLEYKSTLYQDKDSMTLNTVAKILSVTEADGVTTVLTQKTTPMENTPLGVKTDTTTTVYTAADKSTKFIMSTAEEAKQGVIDMIKNADSGIGSVGERGRYGRFSIFNPCQRRIEHYSESRYGCRY